MTPLLALVALRALLVTAQVNFQVDVKESTRAGDSYTPGLTPSSAGHDYNAAELVTPGAQFNVSMTNHQELMLRYAPQFFWPANLTISPTTNQDTYTTQATPEVLHRAQISYAVGDPRNVAFKSGVNYITGQLDLSNIATLIGSGTSATTGTVGQAQTNSQSQYRGIDAYLGLEKDVGRDFKFVTLETVGKIGTPGGNAASVTGDVTATTTSAANANITLQEELSFFSKNELAYAINQRHSLLFDLQLSDVSFTGLGTYIGAQPQVGWESQLSGMTHIRARVGAIIYAQQIVPNSPYTLQSLAACDFSLQHTFSDWHLPRLHGTLTASVGPFYDLVVGGLEPRSLLAGELTYDFTQKIHGTFGLRALTGEYPSLNGWRPLQNLATKNMFIANLGFAFQVAKWISIDLGAYADQRTFQVSAGQVGQASELREAYVLLGATGTWHTGHGAPPAAPQTGVGGGGVSAGSPGK